MEKVISLPVFDYSFSAALKKLLLDIVIISVLVCTCIYAVDAGSEYWKVNTDTKVSGTCVKYVNVSDHTASIKAPLAEAIPGITDSLVLPDITAVSEPDTVTGTDAISDSSATADTASDQSVILSLPNEAPDEVSAPTDDVSPETVYSGFIVSESGIITGCVKAECNLKDGLLVLPPNENCTGVDAGAFAEIEDDVYELFIPDNITYIAPGALDTLGNLMYIQVMDGNPTFYSENGRLYSMDGSLIADPLWKSRISDVPEV